MPGLGRNQKMDVLFGDSLMVSAPKLDPRGARCFLEGIDATNTHVRIPISEDMLGRPFHVVRRYRNGKNQCV